MFNMKFLACVYDGTCRKFNVTVLVDTNNIEDGKKKVIDLLISDSTIKDYQLVVSFVSSQEVLIS